MECFKFNIEERFQCLSTGQIKYTFRPEYCLPLCIPLEAAINLSEINEWKERQENSNDTEYIDY